MQPGPAASAATKPPRRRVRSESDRKKHAGWRRCPRCARSVSTNGRNFYHHMHKCDRVFFADVIARIDATRTKLPTNSPPPQPSRPSAASLLSPTTPPRPTVRIPLTDNQRAIFIQQLCFLRVYDRTVDSVFRQVESTQPCTIGQSVFEAVRVAKSCQAQAHRAIPFSSAPYSPAALSPPSRNPYTPVPLPEALASPLTPHQDPHRTGDQHYASAHGASRPAFGHRSGLLQPPQAIYHSAQITHHQQQVPAFSAPVSAAHDHSQVPGPYHSAEMQTSELPRVSAHMYGGTTSMKPTNYSTPSHDSLTHVPIAQPNFSAPMYTSASVALQSSVSSPAATSGSTPLNESVVNKAQHPTKIQGTLQVPISVSTPTSISASVSAMTPSSGHNSTPASAHHRGQTPAQINMSQPASGCGNLMLSDNRPVCSGSGETNADSGKSAAAVPTSEAQQPLSLRPVAPRQASAMSISSVINN